MEFEFDKEIDAILRKARGGEVVTSLESHLDADEIAAFAENALPEMVRHNYTAHFADCLACRKILSNVILLNGEAETKAASSAVSAEIAEAKTPWYRKLFAFPQIAYTMGALVVLFSGFFGYLILQNLSSADRTVSYSANSAANKAVPQAAPYAASNSNTAANTSARVNESAPLSASNSMPSATPAERKSAVTETDAPTDLKTAATPAPQPATKDEAEDDKNLAKISPSAPVNQPNIAAGATREENKADKKEAQSALEKQSTDALRDSTKTKRSAPERPKINSNEAGERRSVGGKTFNNVGGIWFDAAYTNQKQKTVRRGTKDYLKLDAGLRSIADGLGGTVVILWSGKAYRIQ